MIYPIIRDSKSIVMHFVLARKKRFNFIFSPILLSEPISLSGNLLYLQFFRPRKSIIIDLFSFFLNAGVCSKTKLYVPVKNKFFLVLLLFDL